MPFLEEMFVRQTIEKLGGTEQIRLFGRDVSIDELLPVGSEIREDIFTRWLIKLGEDNRDRLEKLIKISENRQRLNSLSENFSEGSVVPFLGAGTSAPSKMMTWGELLNDLKVRINMPRVVRRIDNMLSCNEYEEAADEIYKRLGRNLFDELIKNKYNAINFNEINGIVRIIPDIFDNLIVTTNFDNIIETVLDNYDETYDIFEGLEVGKIDELDFGNHLIIKLHGDIRNPSNRILIKTEYDSAYRNARFKRFIKKLAKEKSLLFIGCSLVKDRYLDTIRPRGSYSHSKSHYAVMKLPMRFGERGSHDWIDKQERLLSRFNIFPIWIEEYSDIDVILFTLVGLRAKESYDSA